MNRRTHPNGKPFDIIGELITGIEAMQTKDRASKSTEHQLLAERARATAAEFERGLLALYQAEGNSSGITILVEDFERVARRAVRMAEEHGATPVTATA